MKRIVLRNLTSALTLCSLLMGWLAPVPALLAQTNIQSGIMTPVTTRAYNNARTGVNLSETILTQANIQAKGIRKYFSLPMEGDARGAEAQTLIAPSIAVDDGTTRDLAIVATMNGLVYVYDANDSDIIWVKKLSVPVNGSKNIDAWKVNDHWSVLSTPVIDLETQRIYIVAWTDPAGNYATAKYYLHVLNLKDGSRVVPPVLVTGSSNGQNFNDMIRKQRSSLLLTNINGVKTVFFACGTVSETGAGAAGYVFAFDVASNTFTATLADSQGDGAGIWMAGGGLVADKLGFLYATTGNGGFDGVKNFAESTIKIQYTPPAAGQAGSLKVIDHWTAFTDSAREGKATSAQAVRDASKLAGVSAPSSDKNLQTTMAANSERMEMNRSYAAGQRPVNAMATNFGGWDDEDYGSAGISMWTLPNGTCILVTSGKDGIEYTVNCNKLGQTTVADIASGNNYKQLVQPPIWFTYFPGYQYSPDPLVATALDFLGGGRTRHQHSTPVIFQSSVNGTQVFTWGENSPLRTFRINPNGSFTYLAQSNEVASANIANAPGGMAGGFMTLSANGSTAGTAILVACIPLGNANTGDNGTGVTAGRLLVYDAENFLSGGILKVLWDSQAWGINFVYNKFNPPVISGGKIFVPTYADTTDVYGLAG